MAQLVWRSGRQGRVGTVCVDFIDDLQSDRYIMIVVGTRAKLHAFPAQFRISPLDW